MSTYNSEAYKKYYLENREAKIANVKDYQTNRRDEGKDKEKEKAKRNALQRVKNAERRRLVFAHYGGKCTCCGETEQAFLQLDHINGGGNNHRREIERKAGGRVSMIQWAFRNKHPEDLQLLCANCNTAKGIFGVCPHKQKGK